MSEIMNCPFCGGIATIQQDTRYPRYGKKDTVKAYEPICTNTDCLIYKADNVYFTSEKKAIAAWNRRAQPENEALTLDELRGMGGEPVWIQESAPYTFAGYKILCSPVVDEYEDVCFEGGDCYYSHDYGDTWLAYRTKPERSEGE